MNKLNKLAEIQNLIQMSVRSRTLPQDLNHVVIEKPPISLEQRLNIYQSAYVIRLKESLRDDFPRIEKYLRIEKDNHFVDNFIKENPSIYQNLAEYSELFVNYIEQNYSELAHLVYLDWFEILSSHVREPKDQLTFMDIQETNNFLVKLKPSTFIKRIGLTTLLVFRQNGEVKSISDVDADVLTLLFYLKSPRSIDDLVKFSVKENIDFNFISQQLQKLIQNNIIYCCISAKGESYV